MEIRTEKNDLDRMGSELSQNIQAVNAEIDSALRSQDRLAQARESRLNNVRQVRGEGFDDSNENVMVLAEVESQKGAYLMNALASLVNDPVLG